MSDAGKEDIDAQKLAFEREKHLLEEGWKRRTFVWTIVSTLLGSGVSVAIALMSTTSEQSTSRTPGMTAEVIEECRTSLLRLQTLSSQPTQSPDSLRQAIARHVNQCNDPLDRLVTFVRAGAR